MTTNDRLDRVMSSWLHEDADRRVPDHLDEVLQVTTVTRQRPAWSSLERWLPVDMTFRPRLFTVPRAGRLVMVAALILVVLAIAILAIGSYQQRLPEPFGLARNGAIVASRDGDIYTIDARTSAESILIGGDAFDFSPVYARDGSRFAFLRSDSEPTGLAMLSLMVADPDGSNVRAVTPPVASLDWFDWSPDGSRIAFISRVDGDGVITVAEIDGTGSTTFGIGQPAMFAMWLPPDGAEILVRGEQLADDDPPPAIFAIRPDGTGLRSVSTTTGTNEFDFQSIAVSPNGSSASFTRWSSIGLPRVHVLDIATGTDRVLPTPAGTGQRGSAVFSPDGSFIAFARIDRSSPASYRLVVAPADGSGLGIEVGPRLRTSIDGTEIAATWAFTPDGSALIATYGEDGTTRRVPVDGSADSVLTEGGTFTFTDIQRRAP